MSDYTDAARREATVLVSDGTVVDTSFNPAGTNGWLEDVIVSWTDHDHYLTWDTQGRALGHEADIVEIVG